MQFPILVIIPADAQDIIKSVTDLMAPYDMARVVEPHKEYESQEEIDYMVEVYGPYGLKADDIDAIVKELEEDSGFVGGHDDGGFWLMTTDNPDAQWDFWRLGSVEKDVWLTTAHMPEGLYPSAVVTPYDAWHNLGALWNMNDEERAVIQARATRLLGQYPDHLAVLLHCHR